MQHAKRHSTAIAGFNFLLSHPIKPSKDFLRTRQLALGTMNLQHLGLEAQLSPCFQSERCISRVEKTVELVMFLNLESLLVFLFYSDESCFSQRDDAVEMQYVRKVARRMLDGVRTPVEDFVFGFQQYKN